MVSAIEKSDLDQVLSRRHPSSRWGPPFGVMFVWRAWPFSSLSTLPGAASAVLASSPGNGFGFRFFVKISKLLLFVRIGTYQSRCMYTVYVYKKHSGVAGRSQSVQSEGQWFESRMALFLCVPMSLLFCWRVFCYQCKNMYDDDWDVV